MAHGTLEMPANNMMSANAAAHSPEELSEIIECEKILQFRDSILSGTHPRIKIQTHPEKILMSSNLSSSSHPTIQTTPYISLKAGDVTPICNEGLGVNNTPPIPHFHSASRLAMSKIPEMNPDLLGKSDEFIKADIQLQRRSLERALREQVEHQRIAAKALLQNSEQLPDFDVSEVLSKAFAIVPHVAATENEPSAVFRSPSSNSFDENTYYSSVYETPTPNKSPEGRKISDDKNNNSSLQNGNPSSENFKSLGREQVTSSGLFRRSHNLPGERRLELNTTPGISHQGNFRERERPVIMRPDSREIENMTTNKGKSSLTNQVARTSQLYQNYNKQWFPNEPTSTQICNHDLPLVAPQPERVSPLPTASDSLILGAILDKRQPAQVTALRHLPTSPSADSSPKIKSKDRRKEKKKRKAKDPGTPESPCIKVEPRFPSPFAPLARPQQRSRGQYDSEVNYERLQSSSNMPFQEHTINSSHWRHRSYEQALPYDVPEYESRYHQIEGNNTLQRIPNALPIRRPQSPQYPASYLSNELRPRAVSTLVGGRYLDNREYISEPVTRASLHPNTEHERSRSPQCTQLGPLRQILVDEHGRQYYSSTPTPVLGQPVTSTTRYRDEELIYDRVPKRTVSSRMHIQDFENDNFYSRRVSPTYNSYRRVVTQPEYLASPLPSRRSSRKRGYSVYPRTASPHGEELDPYRVAPEYRQTSHLEELPREYLRATTSRAEPTRYEAPREYVGRVPYTQPEPHPRGQELRRDIVPLVPRELSVRPNDAPSQWEPYPSERYYDTHTRMFSESEHAISHEGSNYYSKPTGRRPLDDYAIQKRDIENSRYEERYRRRPVESGLTGPAISREPSVAVYAENARRDVYR